MRRGVSYVTLVGIFVLASFLPSPQTAKVYVIHGIPGIDVGAEDPNYPVDMSFNGMCAIRDFTFGQVLGPFVADADPTAYEVNVRESAAVPCTGEEILSLTGLRFKDKKIYSIIVHLNEFGTSVTASVFEDAFGPDVVVKASKWLRRNNPRLIIHHSAAVGPVDVFVNRQNVKNKGSAAFSLSEFANDGESQGIVDLRPGSWVMAWANTGMNPFYGPFQLELRPFRSFLIFAVGSITNGTFTLIVHPADLNEAGVMLGEPPPSQRILSIDSGRLGRIRK